MHILPALGLWDEVELFSSMQVSLSQAARTAFASTNRRAAGENCVFNKAAVSAVKKTTTTLKPLFFYLWWLQVVLGGSLLAHSSWRLMRCRGLEVNASSHIYGSFLWQNRAVSLSFLQAGHVSWSNWMFDDWVGTLFGGCPPDGLCCWRGSWELGSSPFKTCLDVKMFPLMSFFIYIWEHSFSFQHDKALVKGSGEMI